MYYRLHVLTSLLADRAKSIKTKAVINESATDKLIRELREENAKLLAQLMKGNQNIAMDTTGASQEGKMGSGRERRRGAQRIIFDALMQKLRKSGHRCKVNFHIW